MSLVFLVVGILQRRGETAPAAEAGTPEAAPSSADASEVTAVIPSQSSRRVTPAAAPVVEADAPADEDEDADDELDYGGTVLVVAGRPRYHVDGCRYLAGKAAEEVDVLDAREEGFTACGVCRPDDALAAADADAQDEGAATASRARDGEPVVEEDVPGVEVAPARRSAAGGTRAVKAAKAPAKTPAKAAAKVPAKTAAKSAAKATAKATKAVKAAPAPKSAAARKAPTTSAAADVPAKAVKAPGRAAAAKAPTRAAAAASAGPAASAARRPGSVVVIPDRGKFHTAECRFVRGVDGTEVLAKSAATRQGYTACGVCKP